MNLCFIICAVCGMTILACQMIASMLGMGEFLEFADEGSDESHAAEVSDDPSESQPSPISSIDKSPQNSRSPLVRVGAVGLAIAFFGLMGCAAEASHLGLFPTIGAALATATVSYLVGLYLLSRTALRMFDEAERQDDADTITYAQDEDDRTQKPDPWVACQANDHAFR